MKKLVSVLIALTLLIVSFSGCNLKKEESSSNNLSSDTENNISNDAEPIKVDFSSVDADMFTDRDTKTEYDEKDQICLTKILLTYLVFNILE